MKPSLEYLPKQAGESFVVKFFDYAYYPTPWHYHPELELVLVTESKGKRFIGDNISDFAPGNLALIGANLPHNYRNDNLYYKSKSRLRAKSIVIHFLPSSFGKDFLALPESNLIAMLFTKCARGMDITGRTNKMINDKMFEMLSLHGMPRWMKMLEVLHLLSETKDFHYISGNNMQGHNEKESERLNKVFDMVINNFSKEIKLSEVAALVHMAENSFSRYFSQRTRKTFSAFVAEIRLSHACRLLIENEMSIAEICFECGFNNLSNFNRQFRVLYNMNPLTYRKTYLDKA
jgi:AraC-like DNA-binding protein